MFRSCIQVVFRNVKQHTAPGFPKFKSKRETYKSYKSDNHTKINEVRFEGDKIILPKLGAMKCKISKQVEGRIISALIVQA